MSWRGSIWSKSIQANSIQVNSIRSNPPLFAKRSPDQCAILDEMLGSGPQTIDGRQDDFPKYDPGQILSVRCSRISPSFVSQAESAKVGSPPMRHNHRHICCKSWENPGFSRSSTSNLNYPLILGGQIGVQAGYIELCPFAEITTANSEATAGTTIAAFQAAIASLTTAVA